MTRIKGLTAMMVAMLFVAGCGGSGKSDSAAAVEPPAPPPLCLLAIDGSRSYDQLPQARRGVEKVISALPAGTTVSAWWITADSYQPENNIVTSKAPSLEGESANVFERKAKLAGARRALALKNWRRETATRITSTASPRAGHTDVYGFLALAGERIVAHDGPVVVVIYSDMIGNVERYRKNLGQETLGGAAVVLAAFEKHDPKHRARTEQELKSFGAGEVVFIEGDQVGTTDFRELFGTAAPTRVAAARK